jgi:hypothetical protein
MDDLRIKLAVLWLFALLVDLISLLFFITEPGVLQQLIDTGGAEVTPEFQLLGAAILLIMLWMSFLSLTLKDRANRWANIIVPLVYLVLYLGDFIQRLSQPKAYGMLLTGSDIIVFALIIWYAWKSKPEV